jgi:hypothetical protein
LRTTSFDFHVFLSALNLQPSTCVARLPVAKRRAVMTPPVAENKIAGRGVTYNLL